MKKLLAVVCGSLLLAGCFEPKVESVEFYKNSAEQRKAVLDRCNAGEKEAVGEQNCKNALAAEVGQRFSGSGMPTIK